MRWLRCWGAALAVCALVAPAGAQVAPPAAAPPAAPAVVLEVQAPEDLRALLEQHLDLARLQRLGEGAALDDSEWMRLAGAAPAQARELLRTEGYFNARVTVQRTPGRPQRVRLQVEPGERATIARVDLVAEGELDRRAALPDDADTRALLEAMRKAWPLPVGSAFRNETWSQAKSQVLAQLRAAGYASASFSGTTADVDAEQGRVRLYLVADSGPLYLAGDVVIEGLNAHEADAVRHQAGFAPGTALTETRLLDYQERLVKLGLFDSASVSFEPDPAQAAATPVRVRVRELPLRQLTTGIGVSANTGPRVSLEFTHRRPFDRAGIVHNKIEWGRDRRVWEGELAGLPNSQFQRNLLGVQYEYLVGDSDVVTTERLRLGRSLDTPRLERLVFAEFDRSKQTADIVTPNDFHRDASALTANIHVIWRELDSALLPTRGWSLSLQGGAGQARSPDAPSGAFARLYARATGYLPLGQSWYGQARLELGQIVKRDAVRVPDTLAFRAGGDESVRGYAWRSLAPSISGVTVAAPLLATASLEVARPISTRLPSVWGAAFIDAGRAVDHWSDYKPALGIGVGVRWRSPVGPLKLDWAWGEELRKGRLHMSVGIAF